MTLFPQLNPAYYTEEDRGLLAMMETHYAEAMTINQSFWYEADLDTRFEAGDQTLWNDIYGNLPAFRNKRFTFNRIKRIINMPVGYQRRNRKSSVCIPIENADDKTASQYTKIFRWIDQKEGLLETISEAFHGACITGMNLLHVWMDYRNDPTSGDIKVDNCSYNSYLIDPFFKKKDLSDCNMIWKRSYVTKRQAISLLPDRKDEILALDIPNNRDGKFQYMPESYNYGMRNLMAYDEYWYRDYRSQKIIIDTQTGESTEWMGKNEEDLKAFLQAYPQLTVVEEEVPTVRLGIIFQGKVMYHGPNPMGIDCYPFVPVFGYFSPEMSSFPWRIQGMVRNLRDAQYLYNRRKIIELDILESQINSGFKYKEDALVNPSDIFLSGQGKGLALKSEAQMSDVEQIMPVPPSPAMIQLSEIMGKEIEVMSGVNEELLGAAADDKSGILAQLRQGAGLTSLQTIFDQLDYSQKLLYSNIILKCIQKNFAPGKVKKIVGEEPAPQFYNKAFGLYGCAIEDGMNTTTQKQMQFRQLLDMKELGIDIPTDLLISSSTLQNKTELVEAIQEKEQQQSQLQQEQAKMALEEQQAQIDLLKSRSIADKGLGIERLSRIEENKELAEERKAEAVKDDTQAFLNFVKSLKEIENVDIDQLSKLVMLHKNFSEQSETLSSNEASKSVMPTEEVA